VKVVGSDPTRNHLTNSRTKSEPGRCDVTNSYAPPRP
jgi:hypothetical protein